MFSTTKLDIAIGINVFFFLNSKYRNVMYEVFQIVVFLHDTSTAMFRLDE